MGMAVEGELESKAMLKEDGMTVEGIHRTDATLNEVGTATSSHLIGVSQSI